jgi:hypothetical protein
MPETNSFRNLKVWQAAMTLVEEIYRTTATFPRDERFGLTAQIRRAAVSIASNIGEGKPQTRSRLCSSPLLNGLIASLTPHSD